MDTAIGHSQPEPVTGFSHLDDINTRVAIVSFMEAFRWGDDVLRMKIEVTINMMEGSVHRTGAQGEHRVGPERGGHRQALGLSSRILTAHFPQYALWRFMQEFRWSDVLHEVGICNDLEEFRWDGKKAEEKYIRDIAKHILQKEGLRFEGGGSFGWVKG